MEPPGSQKEFGYDPHGYHQWKPPASGILEIDDFVKGDGAGHTGLPRTIVGWLTTTDHKALGIAYAVASLIFLLIGGSLAGIIRAELAEPGLQIVSAETYNSVFTIHGSVMVYLFAVPFGFALANYLLPLQIGARDMAYPFLNMLSYWTIVPACVLMVGSFLAEGGAAAAETLRRQGFWKDES